ncbi:hypothetical protein C8R45DRAFT_947130 [Mycena sanguinolenta]|nr:hypothetical protein C8R45DRAFT_947130 [Mycena sanguinolenta]
MVHHFSTILLWSQPIGRKSFQMRDPSTTAGELGLVKLVLKPGLECKFSEPCCRSSTVSLSPPDYVANPFHISAAASKRAWQAIKQACKPKMSLSCKTDTKAQHQKPQALLQLKKYNDPFKKHLNNPQAQHKPVCLMASDKRACVQLFKLWLMLLNLILGMNIVAAKIMPKPVCLMPSDKRACALTSRARTSVSSRINHLSLSSLPIMYDTGLQLFLLRDSSGKV